MPRPAWSVRFFFTTWDLTGSPPHVSCSFLFTHTKIVTMSPNDLNPSSDWDGPSLDKIECVVKRTLRRLGWEEPDPLDESSPEVTAEEAADLIDRSLQIGGLVPTPASPGAPHPLASAGIKLKDLRTKSGWTAEEIAERTGISLATLIAFEDGDSSAAGEMTTFDLEGLASACCGTLADLPGTEHSWVQAAERRKFRLGRGGSVDPNG